MEQQTFTEQAGVTYATVGKGKRVHYSPRNDESLCGRAITEYLDVSDAAALFGKGHELCAPCHRAAEKRAEGRRLADASPLAAAVDALVDTIEQADTERAAQFDNVTRAVDAVEHAEQVEAGVATVADAEALYAAALVTEAEATAGTWRGEWIGAQDDDALFPIERDTEQGALFTDRAATEPAVVEGVVVEHAGVATGSTPSNASHPDVAAARAPLARLAAATMTDHHDVTEPTEDERTVRGYLLDPRGQGRVALYWLEEGRIVRRDEQGYGASLDCLAWTMERAGWTVEKLLRSSQCVFAHRPNEDAAPAAVEPAVVEEQAPAASGFLVDPWTWIRRPASTLTPAAAPTVVEPAAPECLHRIAVRPDVSGDPIKTCARKQPNQEAGVFNDEGCVEAYDCAVQAANRAAEWNVEEEAPAGDPTYVWDLLCPDHRDAEQSVDECEECNAEEAAADTVEQAVVEEKSRCITHGAACDDDPKRRHQFEPTAEQVEAAREAKRQAKAKTAARIAELDDVLAMIEQAERVDGTWRGEWIAAAPADAELLALPADAEQGALFA
ncbi:hypothetical protein [Streptomyces sp. NPDC050395]|uniref:hypothetical protein n=1 Tax=Streptomyces sp. NPDC050395 TaxID=3155401 RepID=UPI0034301081